MRLVLDSNVVLSASLWGGKPAVLIELAIAGRIKLVTSPMLLAELDDVVGRSKFAPRLRRTATTASEIVTRFGELADVVSPDVVEAVVLDDPDDDHVLACAAAGRAELIVTGDAHLLALGTYRGIQIMTVAESIRMTEEPRPG